MGGTTPTTTELFIRQDAIEQDSGFFTPRSQLGWTVAFAIPTVKPRPISSGPEQRGLQEPSLPSQAKTLETSKATDVPECIQADYRIR